MPEIIFNGPDGRLEGRYSINPNKKAPIALVLHPMPQFGGTMNHPVSFQLYQSFLQSGFSVLRFNFRGRGRSQNHFDGGIGELADATAALDWLQALTPDTDQCWIGGYGFGAWIGMQLLMRRPEINSFISIAPPAQEHDFSFLAPCPSSGIIIHGDKDKITPKENVDELAKKLQSQKGIDVEYANIPNSSHFFEKKIEALDKIVQQYIQKRLAEKEA
ncbi:MAG: alpha/beta hydrolase [Parvibaculales bacterium]